VSPQIVNAINIFSVLLISLSIHEAAHAWAAKMQGDSTAEDMGRLTINPIPHIDLLGTIILPLFLVFGGGGFFGWAKPVPVDPRNFKNQRWGHAIVAAAGPASNMILSFSGILFLLISQRYFFVEANQPGILFSILRVVEPIIWVNALLACFNLIPLPPLDGGAVLMAFLPQPMREWFEDYVAPYGSFILLALIFTGGLHFISTLTRGFVAISQSVIGVFIL
jgi:Zn-dependent protease